LCWLWSRFSAYTKSSDKNSARPIASIVLLLWLTKSFSQSCNDFFSFDWRKRIDKNFRTDLVSSGDVLTNKQYFHEAVLVGFSSFTVTRLGYMHVVILQGFQPQDVLCWSHSLEAGLLNNDTKWSRNQSWKLVCQSNELYPLPSPPHRNSRAWDMEVAACCQTIMWKMCRKCQIVMY